MFQLLKTYKWLSSVIVGLGVALAWGLWLQGSQKGGSNTNAGLQGPTPRLAKPQVVSPTRDRKSAILEEAGFIIPKETQLKDHQSQTTGKLNEIFGASGVDTYRRIGLLKGLGFPLSDGDKAGIFAFLKESERPADMSVGHWHWLIDEALTVLRNDGTNNAEVAAQLGDLYRNTSADPIVRDYAVQHLGHLLSTDVNPGLIVPVLRDAISNTENTIAGSALLALDQHFPDDLETSGQAFRVASDPRTSLTSRVTALQVASSQKHPEALPLALGLASDSNLPTSLRLSAIATIADLGMSDQLAFLKTFSAVREPRLYRAATVAITKLSQ